MIAAFDIRDVNKAAAAFDPEKLQWLNQQHMMRAPVTQLAAGLRESLARLDVQTDEQRLLEGVVNAQRERARTLREMAQNSRFFFRDFAQYEDKAARKHLTAEAVPLLAAVNEGLSALPEWNAGAIHEVLDAVAGRNSLPLGKVAQPLRVAISGTAVSPPIDVTVALLGRTRSLARVQRAMEFAAGN
jgi:glutamyl-tRNA synthetase